jgi:pyruvate/2-oxoacid:ferredoxin oxidoreductase beta subunit/Pyruvate/2-oxoacid:ferredoxin oxidoreductase gamma subunit
MKAEQERDSYLGERPFPYCKGCGHGLVVRRLNQALVSLRLDPSEVVLTSDIGCVGLVDPLFPSLHTVHTIHGRSTAVAAGAVLADSLLAEGRMKNIVMIGDGGATIGLLHLAQAALMNVDLTVLLHNNMLYGMTGGQHSAFTPAGFITATTAHGNWVPSLDMEQFLKGCQGGFFARQCATDPELPEVIAEAIRYPGFALVEILELCTGYGVPLNRMDGKSLRAIAEAEGRQFGVRIQRADRRPFHELYRERFPAPSPREEAPGREAGPVPIFPHRLVCPIGIVIAGSAGERVQTAAAILCQAAIFSDLCCTQKNDYPVTVGSGFSLSEVALSPEPILYTGSERPDAVVIASPDGLREVQSRGDLERLASGGIVIADESVAAEPPGGRTLRLPLRRTLSPQMAALGGVIALVERTGILDKEALLRALEAIVGREAAAFRRAVETAWGLGV